jgi:hypothetical protein
MDWIAVLLNVAGLWLLAKHPLRAMYVYVASSTAFLIWAIYARVWSIVALQVLLLVLNVRVVLMWRKK